MKVTCTISDGEEEFSATSETNAIAVSKNSAIMKVVSKDEVDLENNTYELSCEW